MTTRKRNDYKKKVDADKMWALAKTYCQTLVNQQETFAKNAGDTSKKCAKYKSVANTSELSDMVQEFLTAMAGTKETE